MKPRDRPEPTLITETELLDLGSRALSVRLLLRATKTTTVAGEASVRVRSMFRSHDRMGSVAWQPGDSFRLLIVRDLINRDQLTIRTYHAQSEVRLQVILDPARSLLGHEETGPFALKLAFCLAMSALKSRQAVVLTTLRGQPPGPPLRALAHVGGLVRHLVAVRPERDDRDSLVDRLTRDLGVPRANTNAFLITHCGHPLDRFEFVLRTLAEKVRHSVAFVVLAEDELIDDRPLVDPETGAAVEAPGDRVGLLVDHLDTMMKLGRRVGVVVQPLVVRDHREDIETLLPLLASVT